MIGGFIITTQRLENESYISYLKRIVRLAADKQISYTEMGDCLLGSGNVYSEDNLRKAFYCLNKIVDKIDDNCQVTDNEVVNQIETLKDELYKERVRYRDKLREFNKKLASEARFENLKDTMLEAIKNSGVLNCTAQIDYSPIDAEASLLISDIHYGIKIDNQLNCYNTQIAKERINELFNKAIYYCKIHRVKTLNIEILGDVVSGLIHTSVRVEQEEDIITQIIEVADILANMINKLREHIPKIKVYTVFGNHSRAVANRSDNLNRENLERLVYHYIQAKLPDIEMITSLNDDYLVVDIADRKIILEHGDKGNNPILDYVNLLNFKANEIHRGHYHHFSVKNDNDCVIITNGSVVGSDEYAVSIRKSTKPSQTLRVYDKDICTYEIILN